MSEDERLVIESARRVVKTWMVAVSEAPATRLDFQITMLAMQLDELDKFTSTQ